MPDENNLRMRQDIVDTILEDIRAIFPRKKNSIRTIVMDSYAY